MARLDDRGADTRASVDNLSLDMRFAIPQRSMRPFDEDFRSELARLLRVRRDVRRFQRTPVADEVLHELLQAAHAAPSVGLSQPWRFVLVDDDTCRDAVRAEFVRSNALAADRYDDTRAQVYRRLKLAGLSEAPVHLLVCVERDPDQGHGLGRASQPTTVRDSAVCAIQNLWLAARAHGIGVGWVSILHPDRLREPLAIPTAWDWVAYLCIGYPEQDDATPELERVGWERRSALEGVLHRR